MRDLIFGLIGGTALLMYGVDKMGDGLEKASGEMMKKILSVLTGKVWSAFLVGTLLTALVQSSTAITVLTVGFVNAGLMKLPQAVGVIYGANIGTTITAQIMSASFEFKLTDYALPLVGIGFAINYLAKNKTLKNLGSAIMGFGMMFLGLKTLNSGVPYMQSNATFNYFFQHYASIPVVAILLGGIATALVQSSSATVGLTMVLAKAGLLDLQASICIMLGDNIGTCITAQLASLTGNINARRTAWAHTLYNIFGVAIVSLVLPFFMKTVVWVTSVLQPGQGLGAQIANSHTIFNVLSAAIFLPITKYYVRFLETVIRSRKSDDEDKPIYLNKLLLDTPVAAFKASLSEITRGIDITKRMLASVLNAIYTNDNEGLEAVQKDEELINQLQKDITLYIVDIAKRPLSDTLSPLVPAMINSINNIERVGDHAIDMLDLANTVIERRLSFSPEAIKGLKEIQAVLFEMIDNTVKLLTERDMSLAYKNTELETRIDIMSKSLLDNHLARLEQGKCNIESGVLYSDLVNYFERVADHIYKVSLNSAEKMKNLPN